MSFHAPRTTAVLALTLITALAACSSSKPDVVDRGTTAPPACHPPTTGAVKVVADPTVASDHILTSFDGAQIHLHWFPLASPPAKGAPTVLMGPGWGSGGDTNTTATGSQGITSIKDLRDAGYNVLTWDPRGFGKSTGTIEIDSPAAEGKDVQRIIDWVATQKGVELDGTRDPRVGMVGASYGGGIQLTTAGIDCRVDALVPSWAWHSLTTSLNKADTPKTGWSTLLYAAAAGKQLDPHINSANTSASATGTIGAADQAWFASRGPGDAIVGRIRTPTLLVQGTVDTLFTLAEADANYRILKRNGVPVSMLWFCGGHGVCLTNPGDRQRVEQKTLLWLARYLKRDVAVNTGPALELVDQNGTGYEASTYPVKPGTQISGSGSGSLSLVATGGSGPAHPPANNPDLLASFVGPVTPAKASNAVNVSIATGPKATVIVGAPKLFLTYHGTAAAGTRPTRVFAQLVDPTTGLVLGNQITPIALTLDGKPHTASASLEMIAFTTKPSSSLLLQIVATTVAYSQPRLGGTVSLDAHLDLPVSRFTPKQERVRGRRRVVPAGGPR